MRIGTKQALELPTAVANLKTHRRNSLAAPDALRCTRLFPCPATTMHREGNAQLRNPSGSAGHVCRTSGQGARINLSDGATKDPHRTCRCPGNIAKAYAEVSAMRPVLPCCNRATQRRCCLDNQTCQLVRKQSSGCDQLPEFVVLVAYISCRPR